MGAIRCGVGLYTAPFARESGRARKGGISPVFAGTCITVPDASVVVVVVADFLPMIWEMKNWTPMKMAIPCTADLIIGWTVYQHLAFSEGEWGGIRHEH